MYKLRIMFKTIIQSNQTIIIFHICCFQNVIMSKNQIQSIYLLLQLIIMDKQEATDIIQIKQLATEDDYDRLKAFIHSCDDERLFQNEKNIVRLFHPVLKNIRHLPDHHLHHRCLPKVLTLINSKVNNFNKKSHRIHCSDLESILIFCSMQKIKFQKCVPPPMKKSQLEKDRKYELMKNFFQENDKKQMQYTHQANLEVQKIAYNEIKLPDPQNIDESQIWFRNIPVTHSEMSLKPIFFTDNGRQLRNQIIALLNTKQGGSIVLGCQVSFEKLQPRIISFHSSFHNFSYVQKLFKKQKSFVFPLLEEEEYEFTTIYLRKDFQSKDDLLPIPILSIKGRSTEKFTYDSQYFSVYVPQKRNPNFYGCALVKGQVIEREWSRTKEFYNHQFQDSFTEDTIKSFRQKVKLMNFYEHYYIFSGEKISREQIKRFFQNCYILEFLTPEKKSIYAIGTDFNESVFQWLNTQELGAIPSNLQPKHLKSLYTRCYPEETLQFINENIFVNEREQKILVKMLLAYLSGQP